MNEFLNYSNEELFGVWEKGLIQGSIAKDIAEWIVIEKLCPVLLPDNNSGAGASEKPETWEDCRKLMSNVIESGSSTDILEVQKAQSLATIFETLEKIDALAADDQEEVGKLSFEIKTKAKAILKDNFDAARNFNATQELLVSYDTDVAQKLRSLIASYA